MKKTIALSILILSISSVSAENLFPGNNPFPNTVPQTMNNIYESEPATMKQEQNKAKKFWFKKGKNLQQQDIEAAKRTTLPTYPANEGINEVIQNDGSFYVFK